MKLQFSAIIAIFFSIITIQIKPSENLLNQVYSKINNNKYLEAKEDITKNIESLSAEDIHKIFKTLNEKKTLNKNAFQQFLDFYDPIRYSSYPIAILLAIIVTELIFIIKNPKYKRLDDKYRIKKELSYCLSILIYFFNDKLFDAIYNNKKAISKKLIEEIMDIETYLKNRLLILNQ